MEIKAIRKRSSKNIQSYAYKWWNTGDSQSSSSDSKSSGTSASIGCGAFWARGVVEGAHKYNNEQGNSVNQQQSHSKALSKIQSAVKEGILSTTDSEIQSLSENFSANLSEQQSIG